MTGSDSGTKGGAAVAYTPSAPADARRPPATAAAVATRPKALPRSDIGTVAAHWLAVAAVVVSLGTGLRISADALDSTFAATFAAWLPTGEVWTLHLAAGLVLTGLGVGYALYALRSGISARLSTRRVRTLAQGKVEGARWGAVAVSLHWTLFAALAIQGVTGVLLYLGHGGWVVTAYLAGAVAVLGYIGVHVVSHIGYGGWRHLLRILRPAPAPRHWRRRRPLLIGGVAAVAASGTVVAVDLAGRDVLDMLPVEAVRTAPALDGRLDDEAWRGAKPVAVRTHQGANLGGTGESTVEIRAVRTEGRIHFAFRWSDPTRSPRHLPLVKREDGWHLVHGRYDIQDETLSYEDKFSVLFSPTPELGGGGSMHLGARPRGGRPGALHGRGLHYTTDGRILDMWHWKPARAGLLGHVDDNYFGPPIEPKPAQVMGAARYHGGYQGDPGTYAYTNSFAEEPPGGYRGPVRVRYLPRDHAATAAALGRIDPDPRGGVDEGARWWMTEEEAVPHSAEADAAIPVGTVIPGVVIRGRYSGDRADVAGGACWEDGWWTLEASRALDTGSRYDQAFVPGTPVYMWVSVFDQSQTRHTRHPRPVRLELR